MSVWLSVDSNPAHCRQPGKSQQKDRHVLDGLFLGVYFFTTLFSEYAQKQNKPFIFPHAYFSLLGTNRMGGARFHVKNYRLQGKIGSFFGRSFFFLAKNRRERRFYHSNFSLTPSDW